MRGNGRVEGGLVLWTKDSTRIALPAMRVLEAFSVNMSGSPTKKCKHCVMQRIHKSMHFILPLSSLILLLLWPA